MDEQTGSPGANTENNSQKNGDEVRAEPVDIVLHIFPNFKNVWLLYMMGDCSLNLQNISAFAIFAEAPTWQLDQGEEEEEANERQQCTQSPPNGLCPLHERQEGAATG